MLKRSLILVALAIMATPAMAQTSFYSDRALQQVNVLTSPTPLTAAIPYGPVRVCSLPLTQQSPCLPLASITDINGNAISNAIGGNFGQLTTDATGRFTFGCSVNTNYQVQITQSASNTPAVNYPISCPGFGQNLSGLVLQGPTTFQNSAAQNIANSPSGATESANTVTITTSAVCTFVAGQAITISGVGVSGYNGGWTVLSPGCNGGSSFTYRNPVQSLAASGGGTVTGGSPIFTGRSSFIGGIGSNTFSGPSPWIDVTDPVYGAKCDGSTDDTAAFNSALVVANTQLQQSGGTIWIPSNPQFPGPCVIASQLVMDNMSNIAIVASGFSTAAAGGNASQAHLKFTGTCLAAACLSLRSTSDISFWGVRMSFPNLGNGTCTNVYSTVTLCPAIDLSHAGANGDSVRIKFHGGAITGPSVTQGGPLVLDQNTDEVTFDQWILFSNATVFVSGPVNNTAGFSDKTHFNDVQFFLVGTSAIQNASVDWTIQDCIFTLRNGAAGTNGVPALQYVNGYLNQQNTVMIGNEFLAQISPTNTFTLVTVPAPGAGTNLGGLKFESELVAITDANMTALNIGNSNAATISTNTFSSTGTVLNVGTAVQLTVNSNVYLSIGIFLVGTPQNGIVTNNAGVTTIYSGTNNALQITNGNVVASGTLSFAALTNNTGFQAFNTATSCTTAATINTPCTTASITLPSGYADTNYRIGCSGLTRTNFPQIIDYAKSNTTFTITLNNLTAAAATYASFDCWAAHN